MSCSQLPYDWCSNGHFYAKRIIINRTDFMAQFAWIQMVQFAFREISCVCVAWDNWKTQSLGILYFYCYLFFQPRMVAFRVYAKFDKYPTNNPLRYIILRMEKFFIILWKSRICVESHIVYALMLSSFK